MKSKKIIAISVLLLLIAAVTAFVGLGTVTQEAAQVVAKVTQRAPRPPAFVKLGNFVVPVVRGNEVASQVNLAIALEMVDDEAAEKAKASMVRLRDAFMRDLVTAVIWQHRDIGETISLIPIKQRLFRVSADVLGQ